MNARGGPAATEGELWASAQLAELRAGGYHAGEWVRLIERSAGRAAETGRRRPRLVRQATRWMLAIGLALVLLRRSTARDAGRSPSFGRLAAWWLLESLMLGWHLGMVEGLDGEPREGLAAADALTLGRAAIAPFAAGAPPGRARFLGLVAFAGVSDLLDGRLARRRGATRFGRDFDPLADLAFRAGALRGARRAGWVRPGPVRAVAVRQALLVAGGAWSWLGHARRPPVDRPRIARWDGPPLFAGLALAALGRQRSADLLISFAAVLGIVGLLTPSRAGAEAEAEAAPPPTRPPLSDTGRSRPMRSAASGRP